MNKDLTGQIVSMQAKQQKLEETMKTFKKYKQILHLAAGIQCMTCHKLFTREEFSLHLPDCQRHMLR